jgi:hypothetical protein
MVRIKFSDLVKQTMTPKSIVRSRRAVNKELAAMELPKKAPAQNACAKGTGTAFPICPRDASSTGRKAHSYPATEIAESLQATRQQERAPYIPPAAQYRPRPVSLVHL